MDPSKRALKKDNWTITHDPFLLKIGNKRLYADLGADRLISAEKGHEKIAVEIKSFLGPSDVKDLEQALGQFVLYRKVLDQQERERHLYLAVNEITFNGIFADEIGQLLLAHQTLRLIVFDEENEVITQWEPH